MKNFSWSLVWVLFGCLGIVGAQSVQPSQYNMNWEWAQKIGGSGNDRYTSIVMDSSGFLYTAGIFSGPIQLGSFTLTGTGPFVAKYTTTGQVLWARSYGAPSIVSLWSIDVLPNGNLVLAGGWGTGTTGFVFGSVSVTGANNWRNQFVVMLSSTGNVLLADTWGSGSSFGNSNSFNYAYVVRADTDNSFFVGGACSNRFDFGSSVLLCGGAASNFIVKYSSTGTRLWGVVGQGTTSLASMTNEQITPDGRGGVHALIGQLGTQFGSSGNMQSFPFSGGAATSLDLYWINVSSTGNTTLIRSFNSTGIETARGMTRDSVGNVYLNLFSSRTTIDYGGMTGQATNLLISYTSGNVLRWLKPVATQGSVSSLRVKDNIVYLHTPTSIFSSSTTFDTGVVLNVATTGITHIIFAGLNAQNGQYLFAYGFPVGGSTSNITSIGQAIGSNPTTIYSAFQFSGTRVFGDITLTSSGNAMDGLIGKFTVESCFGLSSFGFSNQVIGGFDTTAMCWKKNGYNTLKDESNADVNIETITSDQVYTVSIPYKNLSSTGLSMPRINFLGNRELVSASSKGTGSLDIKIKVFNPEAVKNLLR